MNFKALAVAAFAFAAVPAFASTWKNDPAHTEANFSVRHMGVSSVNGNLGPVDSTLNWDDKDPTKSNVTATIDVTKLTTRNDQRDGHLKSADFFDVEKFKTVTFKSKKFEKGAGKDQWKVTGDLTIKDITKEVVLDVTALGEQVNPFTNAKFIGFTATGKVDREDFGLKWNKALANNTLVAGKEVKISIEAEYAPADGAAKAEVKDGKAPGKDAKAPAAPAPKK